MIYEKFIIKEDSEKLILFLNNPRVNALSRQLIEELNHILQVVYSSAYRVVIFSNEGEVFSAGADLKERKGMSDSETVAFVRWMRETFYRIYTLPVPTVCAMQGSALGGGLELSLACDYRIAAEEGKYGLPETSLGIIPGAGGTQYLSSILGPAKAKEFIFSASKISGKEAQLQRIVNIAVPMAQVLSKADEIASIWCQNAPLALRYAKGAINEGWGVDEHLLKIEEKWYNKTVPTEDRKEALTAFSEKRKPLWKGK